MRKCLYVMSALAISAHVNAQAAETIYVGGYGGSTEQLFKEKIIPPFEAKTGAKLIFGTTTPVPEGKLTPQRTFGDVATFQGRMLRYLESRGLGLEPSKGGKGGKASSPGGWGGWGGQGGHGGWGRG